MKTRCSGLAVAAACAVALAVRAEVAIPFFQQPGPAQADKAFSLVMTNGYGDCYRMNLLRDRENYQAYRGICSYRGFSLSGCSTTGEVVMLRIKASPSMPEHSSILSTSLRWGTTMYVLNDVFRPLCSWVSAGYENWYPFDMSCAVAMYINSGGYGQVKRQLYDASDSVSPSFAALSPDDRRALFSAHSAPARAGRAFSLVMTNGYGDCYRMNLLRDRENYQAYRGICSYRGFSLSGCSTTGEVVMLRIKASPSMPEHFSIVSTSLRWGTTMYFLNDVFRPLNSWVYAGYENWYPFDMSCAVAMYINSGGLGAASAEPMPVRAKRAAEPFPTDNGTGTNLIGVLLPLTGDLASLGESYMAALGQALAAITNDPAMPRIRLVIEDTQTDAGIAYDKMVAMRSNGVHLVLGPESSEECRILKTYADLNDVLLLSSSSTAKQLEIAGDNLVRLAVDDSNQARFLAEQIWRDGITDLAILARTDIYGDGLMHSLINEFTALGGTVFASNWCPRIAEFIPELISNMAVQVDARVAEAGASRVGVAVALFDEGVEVMRQASGHGALGGVRWYGCEGLAQNAMLLTNSAAGEFAVRTRFVCTAFQRFTNALYGAVESNIAATVGTQAVARYPMSAYDALSILALALKQTGSLVTIDQVIAALRAAGPAYAGCTGPIQFNAADDRSNGTYDLYEFVSEGGSNWWALLAGRAPSAPSNVTASEGVYPDKVRVMWNAVSGATCYEVWRGDSPLAYPGLLAATADKSYDDTNALANTPYYYYLRAANANGISAFSLPHSGYRGAGGALNDYDGDARSDLAVFDSATGCWYARKAAAPDVILWGAQWGGAGAGPVPGDYDGDRVGDLVVYEPATGLWYGWSAATASVLAWGKSWGFPGALPVYGDYDADRKSDLAVYDRANAAWYVTTLSDSVLAWAEPWGLPGAVPVPGDYDGDRVNDLAVYDGSAGTWYIKTLGGALLAWAEPFGFTGAVSVPGDYDGDFVSDLALLDSATGAWYIRTAAGALIAWGTPWGWPGAAAVPGDYDGDMKDDLAVFDGSTGNWYVRPVADSAIIAWQENWGRPGAIAPGERK
ncbi:MAG: hypothetical protein GX608_06945 [Lentisphaerae bacterium]|nr:hypothetical protein [Lentisphaerota bacterium]